MKQYYFLLPFIFFILSIEKTQGQTSYTMADGLHINLKIENSLNAPEVSDNGDGTITLTHNQQYITDIFAKYDIYDFYLKYPENYPEYYVIICNDKDLINELKENVPTATITTIEPMYASTSISQDIITALDGVSFDVLKHTTVSDETCTFYCGENPFCHVCILNNVSIDFNFSITFNYNAEKEVLYVKSDGISPCGNEFSIGLKGGEPDYYLTQNGYPTLQLWETVYLNPSLSDNSQPCHTIESRLYYILGISSGGVNFNNMWVNIDQETNHLRLRKDNAVFGEEIVEFSEVRLSVEDKRFKNINLISSNSNPYINFSGIENSNFNIEVFNILGKKIIQETPFENNSTKLKSFPSGLYFIKLSSSENRFKTYKYVN